MILVDTSVWINHFRKTDGGLSRLLEEGRVSTHPFVIGEIALGGVKNRGDILSDLANLPSVTVAADDEVLGFIDKVALAGSGVGYLDAHLLASVRLTAGAVIWTHDRNLRKAAMSLNLAFADADRSRAPTDQGKDRS